MRLTPLLFLAACASPKPVIGPAAVEARPAGKDVLADADRRWEAFSLAQSEAWKIALEQAKAATPPLRGVLPNADLDPGRVTIKREPSWLPDAGRFRVTYSHTIVQTQRGLLEGAGCAKYRHYVPDGQPPPQPEPQSQPSPMPCPPPVPVPVERSWSATMGLVLEYSEDGKLVAERPSPPAPNLPKTDAPKP